MRSKVIQLGLFIVSGFLLGISLGLVLDQANHIFEAIFLISCFVVLCAVMGLLQVVIHEGGHLVFGLLSGYRFISFRIFSYHFKQTEDGIKLFRFSIAGTGGQCLMEPPDLIDGKMPYKLYNFGGSILNVLLSLPVLPLIVFGDGYVQIIAWTYFIVGILFALLNGIPLDLGIVTNDGYNALSLGKKPETLHAMWVQLKSNALLSRGAKLSDVPDEWTQMPSLDAMQDSMVTYIGLLNYQKKLVNLDYTGAREGILYLQNPKVQMIDIHRQLMVLDLIYLNLIEDMDIDGIDALMTKQFKAILKAMSEYPTVIRGEIAIAVLKDKDKSQGKALMEKFERVAKTYPYPGELEDERHLIAQVWEQQGGY